MFRWISIGMLALCTLVPGVIAHALPKSGPEEVYGHSVFHSRDGRQIHFFLIHPNSEGMPTGHPELHRAYARTLVLGAGKWYTRRLRKDWKELPESFFADLEKEEAWLDGRSTYAIAAEMIDGELRYLSMVRFSWRSADRPLTAGEIAFPALQSRLQTVPEKFDYQTETRLWKSLVDGSRDWSSRFALNDFPAVNPGMEGGEWIEIKNLILAEGEKLDLIPFMLFSMERSGLGRKTYSDQPMTFFNWSLKTQDRYYFTARPGLVAYYEFLGFEMKPLYPDNSVYYATSGRKNYLEKLNTTIRSRRGVRELALGRWKTPGVFESDNWRGLTFYENRDAYLEFLPPLEGLCGGLFLDQAR